MQNQLKVENETRKVGQKNKKHANTVEFREKIEFPGVRSSKQNPSEEIKSYPTVRRLIQ